MPRGIVTESRHPRLYPLWKQLRPSLDLNSGDWSFGALDIKAWNIPETIRKRIHFEVITQVFKSSWDAASVLKSQREWTARILLLWQPGHPVWLQELDVGRLIFPLDSLFLGGHEDIRLSFESHNFFLNLRGGLRQFLASVATTNAWGLMRTDRSLEMPSTPSTLSLLANMADALRSLLSWSWDSCKDCKRREIFPCLELRNSPLIVVLNP